MAGAVAAYGADAVWSVGLEVLGYPPHWAHTVGEVNKVMVECSNRFFVKG